MAFLPTMSLFLLAAVNNAAGEVTEAPVGADEEEEEEEEESAEKKEGIQIKEEMIHASGANKSSHDEDESRELDSLKGGDISGHAYVSKRTSSHEDEGSEEEKKEEVQYKNEAEEGTCRRVHLAARRVHRKKEVSSEVHHSARANVEQEHDGGAVEVQKKGCRVVKSEM